MSDKVLRGEMVLGFYFDRHGEYVMLVRKKRPDWMRGRLNGIGGGVEGTERPIDAMRREFREETGLDYDGWQHRGKFSGVAQATGQPWTVHVYRGFGQLIGMDGKPMPLPGGGGDEQIVVARIVEDGDWCYPPAIVPNLRWLLPAMLDSTLLIEGFYS